MIRLLLFRHPVPSEMNLKKSMFLSETLVTHDPGIEPGAERSILDRLKGIPLDFLLCSPLNRCFQAASALGGPLECEPFVAEELKEFVHLGLKPANAFFLKNWKVSRSTWYTVSFFLQCVPFIGRAVPFLFSGESLVEVFLRIHSFSSMLQKICVKKEVCHVAVITHQIFISLLVLYASFRPGWRIVSSNTDFGGLTEIEIHEEG